MEVRRLAIKETIDDQLLLKMQERKNAEIKRAIGDDGQPASYSVHELIKLFGPKQRDEATGLPVVADPSEPEEEFIFVEDEDAQSDSDAEMPSGIVGARTGNKKRHWQR